MLILTTLTLPRGGGDLVDDRPIILQGPHHSAQKSTSTGVSDCSTWPRSRHRHVHNLVSHGQTPDLSNEAAAGTAPIGLNWGLTCR
jgi:hypothetical protein